MCRSWWGASPAHRSRLQPRRRLFGTGCPRYRSAGEVLVDCSQGKSGSAGDGARTGAPKHERSTKAGGSWVQACARGLRWRRDEVIAALQVRPFPRPPSASSREGSARMRGVGPHQIMVYPRAGGPIARNHPADMRLTASDTCERTALAGRIITVNSVILPSSSNSIRSTPNTFASPTRALNSRT